MLSRMEGLRGFLGIGGMFLFELFCLVFISFLSVEAELTLWDVYRTTKAAVTGFPSACHGRFDTEYEARRFIEEWKDAYADIWRLAIRQGLDEKWRPEDLKVDLEKVLNKVDDGRVKDEDEESICSQFEDLELDRRRRDSGVRSRSLV